MGMGLNVTGYDLVIAAIFVFFMARGIWVGLLRQVTVIVALYVGYLVAGQYHDRLFPFLRGVSENPQIVFLLAYAILFACTYVLTMLLGKALTGVVQLTIADWFDKVLGAVFGAVKALILAILLHMLLTTFLPPDAPLLRQCHLCPYLTQAMILFQQVIKDDKVRQAFQKKEPAISDQVGRPSAIPGSGDTRASLPVGRPSAIPGSGDTRASMPVVAPAPVSAVQSVPVSPSVEQPPEKKTAEQIPVKPSSPVQ